MPTKKQPRPPVQGIAAAIRAQADHADSVAGWIHFCTTAATIAEAQSHEESRAKPAPPGRFEDIPEPTTPLDHFLWSLCKDERTVDAETRQQEFLLKFLSFHREDFRAADPDKAAQTAAAFAFTTCLPPLTSHRRIKAYIACTAVATQRRYIDAKEAKTMLYTAQIALAAHAKRPTPRGRKGKTS